MLTFLSSLACCSVVTFIHRLLLGNFRLPSSAANDNSAQHGDHGGQVDISPAHVDPHLQQCFGDRGDACYVFEEFPYELKSAIPASSASFVCNVADAGIPTVPARKSSSSLDVKLTGKPMHTQAEYEISAASEGHTQYECKYDSQTVSDGSSASQTTRNVLPGSISSTDKRLNWETLFMPYRKNDAEVQTMQPMPVTAAKDTRKQAPVNLATLHDGFTDTCIRRQCAEDDIDKPPNCVDNTSMDDTSIWVMSREISA